MEYAAGSQVGAPCNIGLFLLLHAADSMKTNKNVSAWECAASVQAVSGGTRLWQVLLAQAL